MRGARDASSNAPAIPKSGLDRRITFADCTTLDRERSHEPRTSQALVLASVRECHQSQPRPLGPDLVRHESTAAVVAVDGLDDVDAAVAVATDVQETVIARELYVVQSPMAIDESDTRNVVPGNPVEEAVSATDVDVALRRQEVAGWTATTTEAAAIDLDQTRVVPLEADDVERRMSAKAASGRDASACHDSSERSRHGRSNRRWESVSWGGRALEGLQFSQHRSTGCSRAAAG